MRSDMSVIAYTHTHIAECYCIPLARWQNKCTTHGTCVNFFFGGPCSTVKAAAAKSKRVGYGASFRRIKKLKKKSRYFTFNKNLSMICVFCTFMLIVDHVFLNDGIRGWNTAALLLSHFQSHKIVAHGSVLFVGLFRVGQQCYYSWRTHIIEKWHNYKLSGSRLAFLRCQKDLKKVDMHDIKLRRRK